MPDSQAAVIASSSTSPSTVSDAVALLHRWAAADDALETEAALIMGDASSVSRVSQGTVERLEALLGARLRPGVDAKTAFAALPTTVRRGAITAWAAEAAQHGGTA